MGSGMKGGPGTNLGGGGELNSSPALELIL